MLFFIETFVKVLTVILPLLIGVAYFTLAERQLMSSIQRRRGPNVVGLFGIIQPLADGLKLLTKETILPSSANTFVFLLAPVITFILALIGWAAVPLGEGIVLSDLNFGVL